MPPFGAVFVLSSENKDKVNMENYTGKKDCFAYQTRRCMALTEMLCKTRKCPFYKTRRQFIEDLKKYPPPEGMHWRIKDLKE